MDGGQRVFIFFIFFFLSFCILFSQVLSPFIKMTRAWWLLCLFPCFFFVFFESGPFNYFLICYPTSSQPLSAPLSQYSYHQLNFLNHSILLQKDHFSAWLKTTYEIACPLRSFHPGLGMKVGVSLKLLVVSFRKSHLHLILRENSSKSFLSSGSFMYHQQQSCAPPVRNHLKINQLLVKLLTCITLLYIFFFQLTVTINTKFGRIGSFGIIDNF